MSSNPGDIELIDDCYCNSLYIFNRTESYKGYFQGVFSSGSPMTFKFQGGYIWINSNSDGDEFLIIYAR